MNAMGDGLMSYADLAARWRVTGKHWKRQVRRHVVRVGLKPVRLGHRTVFFRPADVQRCEARLAGERAL